MFDKGPILFQEILEHVRKHRLSDRILLEPDKLLMAQKLEIRGLYDMDGRREYTFIHLSLTDNLGNLLTNNFTIDLGLTNFSNKCKKVRLYGHIVAIDRFMVNQVLTGNYTSLSCLRLIK